MPLITRLMLQNFKKFPELDLRFTHDRNILVGDNESGKSTILLALDLVLSDSRHRVEALGVESLLSQSAVRQFQEGERRADQLPVLTADVFLSNGGDPDLNGRQNLAGINADGLRMRIAPMTEEYGQDIHNVLQQDPDNFPYEYYSVRFSTFSGGHFASFRRYLRHLLLDSARIDNEHAAQEYTRTVYSVNVPVADRYRLENSYRQQKMHFCTRHLSAINDTLETYQFGVRSGAKSGLEANLDITEDGISIRHRGKGRQCFIKTEFALARRVLLVEGDAEFILIEAFYRRLYGRAPEEDGVHIIAIGGTSFRRYLELARLLENRVAALRDNDGNYQQNCDERYADVICSRSRVFADRDNTRSTFEISLYQDNADLCDTLFRGPRRTLTVQEYMLANKAEAAFRLLQLHAGELTVPDYIQEALAWIRE
uniref:Putative ATP-dependent endonuclease of the OLD family n=1 Tax=Escherichia coli TaxID=562 RepID=A0A345AMV9_ECOLX|nr:ATP-dependent endonuclease [Escherichia coli]AXF37781.1 putative ATP-dependent endonuclease of the OLD family [Escherichia coli]